MFLSFAKQFGLVEASEIAVVMGWKLPGVVVQALVAALADRDAVAVEARAGGR